MAKATYLQLPCTKDAQTDGHHDWSDFYYLSSIQLESSEVEIRLFF